MFLYINRPSSLILLLAILFPLIGFGQNNLELKADSANVCVLKLDYETYKFNGGNLSYHQLINIKDSLPISVNFNDRNLDDTYITLSLESTGDTVFNAWYDWIGHNDIKYPSVFSMDTPFNYINAQVPKPSNIQFYNILGKKTSVDSITENKIWLAIDSLNITNKFAAQDFKIVVYPYNPMHGHNEWIVFLINSESANSVNTNANNKNTKIFPNPANEYINIALPENANRTNIIISDINGKQLYKAAFNTGGNPIQIPVKNFAKGIYLLQVNTQDKTETYKIIKQ